MSRDLVRHLSAITPARGAEFKSKDAGDDERERRTWRAVVTKVAGSGDQVIFNANHAGHRQIWESLCSL